MRTLNRVLTLLVSVAVIAAGVLLAVEVVVGVLGSHPLLLDWRAAYRAGLSDRWDSAIVRLVAGAVALVGLLLLLAELKPRRVRRLKVSSDDANTDAAVTRAGMRSALRRGGAERRWDQLREGQARPAHSQSHGQQPGQPGRAGPGPEHRGPHRGD